MRPGAHTPEELETLLEDAFVIRDSEALAQLFDDEAVLIASGQPHEARGDEIVRVATAMWEHERTYVAEPQRILQARDTALVLADRGINVARRGGDGAWRYVIAVLTLDVSTTKEEQ